MNELTRDELRRRMAETVTLPHDDPERLDMLGLVIESGEWAEKEWLDLVRADEVSRLKLHDVAVPEGLADRLLEFPSEKSARTRFRLPVAGLALAASILLAFSVAPFLQLNPASMNEQLEEFGFAAVSRVNFLTPPDVQDARTEDLPEQMLGVPVRMPEWLKQETHEPYELVGAEECRFPDQRVVCLHVKQEHRRHMVFAFRPNDFGLPREIKRQSIQLINPRVDGVPQPVTFWTEGDIAYAMVHHNPSLERQLAAGGSDHVFGSQGR